MRHAGLVALIMLWVVLLAPALAQDSPPEPPPVPDVDIYNVSSAELLADLSGLYRAANGAYNDGDYETAAAYYIELVRHDGHNETAMYNLACCYGLLGEVDLATKWVEAAVGEGFSELWQLESDPDLQLVRDAEGFDELIAGLEQQIEARRAGLGETLYFEAPTYLRCRVMYPEDYDPTRHYTLLVGLHGFGADTAGFMKLWERFADRDFIFALPQAPYAFNSGLPDPGFSWGWWLSGEGLPRASWQMSEQYVADVIDRLQTTLPVEKTFVLGFSQGAAMSYCVGINHYMLVDGIIPFGGWLDENYLGEAALVNAKNMRVFIAHGTSDNMVEFQSALDAQGRLAELNYDVRFREFDGGHAVPEEVLKEVEQWMFEVPEPKAVEDEADIAE